MSRHSSKACPRPANSRRDKRSCTSLLGVVVLTVSWSALFDNANAQVAPSAPSEIDHPTASNTVIRVARSEDGLSFEDTGEVFMTGAAAPTIVMLSGGRLVAVVDQAIDEEGTTRLAISRSKDNGASWSRAARVRFTGARRVVRGARHGDLVVVDKRALRLYFVTGETQHRKRRTTLRSKPTIGSAVARRGAEFSLDARTRLSFAPGADPHPMAVLIGKRIHLFASGDPPSDAGRSRSSVRHFVSRRGGRFAVRGGVPIPPLDFVGDIVATGGGARAYVSRGDRIVSLRTTDGDRWTLEDGDRLVGGWDPAVAKLEDGTFLMLYCAAIDDTTPGKPQLVETANDIDSEQVTLVDEDAHDEFVSEQNPSREEYATKDVDEEQVLVSAEWTDDVDGAADAGSLAPDAIADNDHDDDADAEDDVLVSDAGEEGAPADTDSLPNWKDVWDPTTSDGFSPVPDFTIEVDYVEWVRDYLGEDVEDNAYDAYSEFMPNGVLDPEGDAAWPKFTDMINGGDYDGPPGPWDPKEHPEWEASDQRARDLLDRFHEAGQHTGYHHPLQFADDAAELYDGDTPLLISMLLPQLSKHRALAKAALAGAWRRGEDGKVSADRMLRAWESILRSANHVDTGSTLIEDLVAIAERALVQKHARWALKHGVFSDKELATAFDTLRELDRSNDDPGQSLRGEHAFAMEITQYLFGPPSPNGPKLNTKRLESILDWGWIENEVQMDAARQMQPDDAYETVEVFDAHYRRLAESMSIGYPQVRTADIRDMEQRSLSGNPLVEMIMPSLSRYYTLRTREETSRRATQLAYATHLYKAETGKFPKSIDELPAEYGQTMRIDPFTGRYFGYRLTEEGPRIYSLSENGIDDGGIHSPRWDDKIENDAGSDAHVFWPPQD